MNISKIILVRKMLVALKQRMLNELRIIMQYISAKN